MLSAAARFGGEYANALSNHLPMALIALDRLGASDEQMAEFERKYSPRLVPKQPSRERLTRATWKTRLGQHAFHTEHAELIAGDWGSVGKDELLRRYLPLLLGGVGGGAFHGLIRTAYGLDADSRSEIVEGLAHWSDAYLALARDRARPELPPATPAESLARIRDDNDLKLAGGGDGAIYLAMAAAAALPGFARHTWSLSMDSGPAAVLGAMAEGALRIYAATKNFTALHLVTSAHALRLVLPWTDDAALALQRYWHACLAAYVTIGKPEPRPFALRDDVPPWAAIKARACAARDDHTIKLVYSCLAEEAQYPQLPYRQIAAQRVGL